MIRRMLATIGSLLIYFCAATFLAEVILLAYWGWSWQVGREKLTKMLAVAQGIDQLIAPPEPLVTAEEAIPEQPAYEEVLDQRARLLRNLELREIALSGALAELRSQQQQLADERTAYEKSLADFENRLATLQEQAKSEGMETVRAILSSVKPTQAKLQIMEMLNQGELDQVVTLLSDMPDSKRAKIIGQFTTPQENELIGKVLERLRNGGPTAELANEALNQAAVGRSAGT